MHYGLLSSDCNNETEFIDKAEKLTREILQMDDLFWGNPPDKVNLIFTCKMILENIEKVKSIPIEKRNYDF